MSASPLQKTGGENECTGELPFKKRSLGETGSPRSGGTLHSTVESEPRRQSLPGGDGGGNGRDECAAALTLPDRSVGETQCPRADGARVSTVEPEPRRPSLPGFGGGGGGGDGDIGRNECTRGLPGTNRSVGATESPRADGALASMFESEPWQQALPGFGGGDNGRDGCAGGLSLTNRSVDATEPPRTGGAHSSVAESKLLGQSFPGSGGGDAGGDECAGEVTGKKRSLGETESSRIGGAVNAVVGSEPWRQSVPGGSGGVNCGGDGSGNCDGDDSRSIRHCVPGGTALSGDSTDESPAPLTATTGGASGPSQPCPLHADAKPAPAVRGVGRMAACGKRVCGDTTGWQDPCQVCDHNPSHAGRRLCSACHLPPLPKLRSRLLWRHIPNEVDMERAVELWDAHMAATPGAKTVVKPGFRPTTECLCLRPSCFYMTFKKLGYAWKRQNPTRCAACATKHTRTWRTPSPELGLFQRWLSSGESTGKCVHESGTILKADTPICDACAAEFHDKGKAWIREHGPKFSVKTLLLYLRQGPAPVRCRSHAFAAFLARRDVLEVLDTGKPVHLDVAVEMMREARAEARLEEVKPQRLVGLALELFSYLSEKVSDAISVNYAGDQLGDDKRTRVQYLMPRVMDPLFVTKLIRSEIRLKGEISKLKEEAASKKSAKKQKISKIREAAASKDKAVSQQISQLKKAAASKDKEATQQLSKLAKQISKLTQQISKLEEAAAASKDRAVNQPPLNNLGRHWPPSVARV